MNEAGAIRKISQLELLSSNGQHTHGNIKAVFFRAWLTYRHGSADAALRTIDSAITNIPNIHLDTSLANFYILKGQCFVKKTQFNLAQEAFKNALTIAEQRNDLLLKSNTMISIGWAYMEDGKPKEAIDFFNEVLSVNPGKSYENRALLLCNIAACHNTLGNFRMAESYAQAGIAVARLQRSMTDLANGLNILARSYYQQGHMERAIRLMKEASIYRQKIADPSMLASDYLELGTLYLKNHQPEYALPWATKAQKISLEHGNALKTVAAYELLADVYNALGNAPASVGFYKKMLYLKDSLSDDRYNQSMAAMQVAFEAEKKNAENLRLKKENLESKLYNAKQQRWMFVLAGCILLFAFVGVYLNQQTKRRYDARLAIQQLQEQKKRSREILMAEENERGRIAADLHDGVCQSLAVASLQLRNIKEQGPALIEAETLVDKAGKEIRNISHQMTPELLLKNGLDSAIRESVLAINSSQENCLFSFVLYEEVPLKDPVLSLMIYRCLQELSNNIIKHAAARKACIQLGIYEDELQLMVEDDGRGFDVDHTKGGLGLQNIKRRITAFAGTFSLDSTVGKGTTVTLSFKNWQKHLI